jgi:hypothetical protein
MSYELISSAVVTETTWLPRRYRCRLSRKQRLLTEDTSILWAHIFIHRYWNVYDCHGDIVPDLVVRSLTWQCISIPYEPISSAVVTETTWVPPRCRAGLSREKTQLLEYLSGYELLPSRIEVVSTCVPLRWCWKLSHRPAEFNGVSMTYELLSSGMEIEIEMHAIERAL